jgi:hypothetical protein
MTYDISMDDNTYVKVPAERGCHGHIANVDDQADSKSDQEHHDGEEGTLRKGE